MHSEWVRSRSNEKLGDFYEMADFEWDNTKALAVLAKLLYINKEVLVDSAVLEAVGDRNAWNHLKGQLSSRKAVFESLAEFSCMMPYKIFLMATRDPTNPLADWLLIFNELFQSMYTDDVDMCNMLAAKASNDTKKAVD